MCLDDCEGRVEVGASQIAELDIGAGDAQQREKEEDDGAEQEQPAAQVIDQLKTENGLEHGERPQAAAPILLP